jgi:hypothetical protein
MTPPRSDFPVFANGYTRALGDAPIMLDGMEVLFDKTVGLYAVSLTPTESVPHADAGRNRTDQ